MVKRALSLPNDFSFFLFGPRQTGKSTLIDIMFTENVWKLNLLNNDEYLFYAKDPSAFRRSAQKKIAEGNIHYIVIDEVQRLPALLTEVHSLMSEFPHCRFVLTGSSARKLRTRATDMLAGRAIERRLHPLTYSELGNRFDLEHALQFGTLPSLIDKPDELQREILRAYVGIYLQEEIRQEGLTRHIGSFSRFLDIAASQCGEMVSYAAMGRDCGIQAKTIQGYFEILSETLIALRLDPWRKSLRKQLLGHPKYYLFDTGVTNAINRRLSEPLDSVARGRLFEQFIILETQRAIDYAKSDARIYFWRTNNGAEVDLLIELRGKIVAACEMKSADHVGGRDSSGLRSFSDEYPDTPLFIVCTSKEEMEMDGITVLPWQRYLERLSGWL